MVDLGALAHTTIVQQVDNVPWYGIAALVTSVATLVGVILNRRVDVATKRQVDTAKETLDKTVTPRVVELHNEVVNGDSTMTREQKESTS